MERNLFHRLSEANFVFCAINSFQSFHKVSRKMLILRLSDVQFSWIAKSNAQIERPPEDLLMTWKFPCWSVLVVHDNRVAANRLFNETGKSI
jgi:hypothetical protein